MIKAAIAKRRASGIGLLFFQENLNDALIWIFYTNNANGKRCNADNRFCKGKAGKVQTKKSTKRKTYDVQNLSHKTKST
jgi:hypothetical protein